MRNTSTRAVMKWLTIIRPALKKVSLSELERKTGVCRRSK